MPPQDQAQILRQLLDLLAYGKEYSLPELQFLVRLDMDIVLDNIAGTNANLMQSAIALVDFAESQDRLVELLDVLGRKRPRFQILGRQLRELRGLPPADGAPPATADAGLDSPAPPEDRQPQGLLEIPARPAPTGLTVFVANPTPDLRGKKSRKAVADALRQAGYQVVPEIPYAGLERQPYELALARDLRNAVLFVQVLGESGTALGETPPLTEEGLQFAAAKQRGIPALRWRPGDLNLEEIRQLDRPHFDYLTDALPVSDVPLQDGERVQAGFLEDFRLAVEARLLKIAGAARPIKPDTHPAVGRDLEILLVPHHDDDPLANQFDTWIEEHALADIVDEGKDLGKAYREQAGIVIIYGKSSYDWVDARAKEARKLAIKRKRPVLALYVGPPDPQRELLTRPARFHILRAGDRDALDRYVADLRSAQTATNGEAVP